MFLLFWIFKKGPFKITYKNVLWLTQPKKIKLKLVLPRFTAKYIFTISTLVISPVNSVGLLFQFWGVKCCYIHCYLVPQRWKLLKPATWCRNEKGNLSTEQITARWESENCVICHSWHTNILFIWSKNYRKSVTPHLHYNRGMVRWQFTRPLNVLKLSSIRIRSLSEGTGASKSAQGPRACARVSVSFW